MGPRFAILSRLLGGILCAASLAVAAASPTTAAAPTNRISWLGGSWYLQGADYPWANYGNDFGANAWGAYGIHAPATASKVDADFAAMASEGVHVVRWFLFCDGRAGITFTNGLPTALDQYVFPDLDAAVAISAKHNIYINFVLLDFSWMTDPVITNGVQLGGHANVINTSAGQTALMNNVLLPVLQRYGHDPQIISWEIMNEPEWAISDDQAVNANVSQPSTLANFDAFTSSVAAAIHANTQAYATVGEAAMKWAQQWMGLGLDFYQIHYYDWMHPYSVTDLYDSSWSSLNLDRPVVVGEFPAAGSSTATLQQYLDTWFNNGFAGAWPWSFGGVDGNGVPDPAVMTSWANSHASAVDIAPQGTSVTSLTPVFGAAGGGTHVVIKGTGFSGVTAVKFGATPAADFSVSSSTQIAATSPAGAGTVDVTVTTSSGTSAVTAVDKFTYLTAVAVLPVVANNAYGGYTTTAYLQNAGTVGAFAGIEYLDSAGNVVGAGDHVASLAPKATWTVRQDDGNGLASGAAGSALVYSDQPLAVFVNEFAPGGTDATSYTAINTPSGVGSTLFAPTIANNAYGGYTTGIGLVNLATAAVNVTVTYRDTGGGTVKAQNLSSVAAGAYVPLYSGDTTLALPNGFAGTATISSSGGNLAAVVNETGPGHQFSSYDAVPAGSTTLFAPAELRNAFGGYNTGTGIQNTTGSAGTVTITYYNGAGTPSVTVHPIAANGYLGIYQGTDIPADGAYTAKITSDVAIAAIVNEVATVTNPAAQVSTSYNTFSGGSSSLHLPLVESAGADGWSTGEGIMNTGTAPTTVTVTYFDTSTGLQVGTPQTQLLQPNAYWGVYQPASGLPSGARASGLIDAPGGQLAVICNESSATSFMSYVAE